MKWHTEKRKISELVPYSSNPRQMTEKQVKDLTKSLEKFNLVEIPAIDIDNKIIAGHQRLKIMQLLGRGEEEIDVRVPDRKLTDKEFKEYNIRSNKNTGEWDFDELANFEIDDLLEWGFDENELKIDLPVEEDDVPEVQVEAVAKLGEIYKLGEHRLMCGDSTKIEDVEKLMRGQKAEILFTSPPYSDIREYGGGKDLSISNLIQFIPTFKPFCEYQIINLGIKRENHEIIEYWNDYIKIARECGYKLLSWNVWNRESATSIGLQTAFFPIFHEWIFVFGGQDKELNRTEPKSEGSYQRQKYSKPGTRRKKDGSLSISTKGDISYDFVKIGTVTTLKAANTIGNSEHPAIFPVQLPAEYIEAMTNEDDIVIDCFGGSGSTLIACEQLNRKAYLMEIDPRYVDCTIKRWENFTSNKAEKIND